MARKTRANASQQGAASGNGGGEETAGNEKVGIMSSGTTARPKGTETKGQVDPATEGDSAERAEGREIVSPAKVDKIYTADSKDRWGADQPTFQDLLGESRKTAEKQAKDA